MNTSPAGVHGGNDQEAARCWQNHQDSQEEGSSGNTEPVSDPRAWQRKSGTYVSHEQPLEKRDLGHLRRCWITVSLSRRSWDDVTCFLISCVCLSFTGKRSPTQTMYVSATQAPIETKNPQVNLLVTKWQHVWLLALDRRRKLNDSMDRLEEVLTDPI